MNSATRASSRALRKASRTSIQPFARRGLDTFHNKYLMKEDRFHHDIQLTALHMSMTLLLSLILSLGTARFSSFI